MIKGHISSGKFQCMAPWRMLALSLVAGLLIACEEPVPDGSPEINLSILEWNGYQHDYYHPEYFAQYGEEPLYTFFADQEDAMQRMRTGYRVDLVHLCAEKLSMARDAGLIKPIDTSRIPRWKDIPPALLEVEAVKSDGEYWLAPWEWGFSTVAYNPELIDIENADYSMFIDPRFKGKTALPSTLGVNLLIAGIIAKWVDPLDPTEAEMQAAPDIFTKMLQNARFIWTDSTQLEQAWVGGDVGISYVFGSASRRMVEEGMSITVVKPVQTWLCGLSISANGRAAEDRAYAYINAMLDTASGARLFKEYGYGHGNGKTLQLLDPDKIKGTGIDDPASFFAQGIYTGEVPPEKKSRLFQMWFEAQAGLQ